MKATLNIDIFKSNLEMFKGKIKALGFWDNIADEVLDRIGSGSYLENKSINDTFLKEKPFVASFGVNVVHVTKCNTKFLQVHLSSTELKSLWKSALSEL